MKCAVSVVTTANSVAIFLKIWIRTRHTCCPNISLSHSLLSLAMPLLEVDESMRAGSKGGLEQGEEVDPKSRRTGGKDGDSNAGKKRLDNTKKNKELQQLLTLMLKTQLRGEQRLRELEGIAASP